MLYRLDPESCRVIGLENFPYVVACFGVACVHVKNIPFFITASPLFFQDADEWPFGKIPAGRTDNQNQFVIVKP